MGGQLQALAGVKQKRKSHSSNAAASASSLRLLESSIFPWNTEGRGTICFNLAPDLRWCFDNVVSAKIKLLHRRPPSGTEHTRSFYVAS